MLQTPHDPTGSPEIRATNHQERMTTPTILSKEDSGRFPEGVPRQSARLFTSRLRSPLP